MRHVRAALSQNEVGTKSSLLSSRSYENCYEIYPKCLGLVFVGTKNFQPNFRPALQNDRKHLPTTFCRVGSDDGTLMLWGLLLGDDCQSLCCIEISLSLAGRACAHPQKTNTGNHQIWNPTATPNTFSICSSLFFGRRSLALSIFPALALFPANTLESSKNIARAVKIRKKKKSSLIKEEEGRSEIDQIRSLWTEAEMSSSGIHSGCISVLGASEVVVSV